MNARRTTPSASAIATIGTPLHQTGLLQAVDHSTKRYWLNLKQLRQLSLVYAGVATESCKHPPLRTRDADRARAQAKMLVDQAVLHLERYGPEAQTLRALARFIVERKH